MKPKNQEVNLIIDIGSGSVGVAVVSVFQEIKPKILYTLRKEIKYLGGLNSKRFLFSVINALETALAELQKDFLFEKINNIDCFFSSLWHLSQTRVLKSEGGKDIKITRSLIEKMVDDEEKLFESSQMKECGDMSLENIRIIEKKIMQIKLNGYETPEPYSKKAKSLEVNLFMSSISENVAKVFEESIFRFFGDKEINYYTFTNAEFVVLRDINPTINDYIFLDVSGEITEVAIVKNGILFDSVSFPFGKNSMVRELLKMLDTNKEELISRISLYKSDKIIESPNIKFSEGIKNIMMKWHKLFDTSIKRLLFNISLPQVIFFMSDNDIGNLIYDFIKLYKFDNIDTLEKLTDIKFVDSEHLNKYVEYEKQKQNDQFLSLEALFLKKVLELK